MATETPGLARHQSPANTPISLAVEPHWFRCADCGEEFSRLIGARCGGCSIAEKARLQDEESRNNRIAAAIGRKGLEQFTFDSFAVAPGNRAAFEAAKGFDPARSSMFLWGSAGFGVGCGKTHLAGAIYRAHQKAEFFKAPALIRWFRLRDPREEEAEIERLATVPVLVIDDLGVEKDSEHAVVVLYEIFDRRESDLRHGLVVTSNLPLDRLARKIGDDRITSRLAGMCDVIEVRGQDMRMVKS